MNINNIFRFIDNYEEIIKTAENFGYVNLRLFCSYYEEDKNELNFLASFHSNKMQKSTFSKDIDKDLTNLLGIKSCLWGEGATWLRKCDYTEAANAPLSDMNKVINYFIDVLIPYSTDKEPVENDRITANQHWQKTISKQANYEEKQVEETCVSRVVKLQNF